LYLGFSEIKLQSLRKRKTDFSEKDSILKTKEKQKVAIHFEKHND